MLRSQVRETIALKVNEIYPSIQGEGLLIGSPAVFIRLQGCNLRCPWCDQPSALFFVEGGVNLKVEQILDKVSEYKIRHVVITGGEPFAQEGLATLVKELVQRDYFVQIETNGTLWQEGLENLENLHITCSPKWSAHWFVHPKILQNAKELKFVVDDVLSTEVLLKAQFRTFLEEGRVILQPEGNKAVFFKKALELQKELSELGFSVRVLPQLHKLFGLP
ncbi:MAG: 7-carboxy-7-deazaguanine synthase QueE [Thermocrinis sp.]|nr:7-carboxy-7-deazaguanine synthase QueE [Thermocrinis sp.]